MKFIFKKNGRLTASEKATFERLPNIWFEHLQLIPVSFVNNGKKCDTYALIDPSSQFFLMLDQIVDFWEISSTETANMSLQYKNINHEMPVAKLDNIVNLAPYKLTGQIFPIRNFYKMPFLNIPPADVAHLNEICQSFKGFRHIKFFPILLAEKLESYWALIRSLKRTSFKQLKELIADHTDYKFDWAGQLQENITKQLLPHD